MSGVWNRSRLEKQLPVVNLSKLVGISKRAFNHATKERRRSLLTPPRQRTPLVRKTMNLEIPGSEFYVWNEANPLAKRNDTDRWYKEFFEAHTSVDAYSKGAQVILGKVMYLE